VGDYLEGVGYEVVMVAEAAAIGAALDARRPYAVLSDRKLDDADQSRGSSRAAYSNSPARHPRLPGIPVGIPQVVFFDDGDGQLTFRLLGREGIVSTRASSRLVDAIRQSDKTSCKEIKTILVIDDELAVLELLTKTLLQRGFGVLRAPDGQTGVKFAASYLPDVIILDFSMPELNGIQVVEQLRAHPRTQNIPILINTGAVLKEEERQRLAGHVQSITFKTERGGLFSELERLGALSEETTVTGVHL